MRPLAETSDVEMAMIQILLGVLVLLLALLILRYWSTLLDLVRVVMHVIIFRRMPSNTYAVRDDRGVYYYITSVAGAIFFGVLGLISIVTGIVHLL